MLFLHQGLASFVEKDLRILQSRHHVREVRFRGVQDIPAAASGTAWADMTFCWFGKLHAFFAVLFCKVLGKPSVVVAGGDDVAREPDINYGMFNFWWKKWCPLFVFTRADLILSVSNFSRSETVRNGRANPAAVQTIHHGFDATRLRRLDGLCKDPLVLTVGGIDWERVRRKGYELFVRAAGCVPEAQFAVIGKPYDDAIEYLSSIASPNMTFTGWVSEADLLGWLSGARVYVQASVHEAFGCAVAEAMLCECLPVVSRRAALPEVVGDCGVYVDELTPEALAEGVREAMALGPERGSRARQRVIDLFPLEKRAVGLLAAIDEVTAT